MIHVSDTLNIFIALIMLQIPFICFPLYFKYHLLLSLYFKYHLLLPLCFKYIYCFSLHFKYIYCFHLHLLRICDYPPSLCDLGVKILIGLGRLCKTSMRH